jgi:hypothetical protein
MAGVGRDKNRRKAPTTETLISPNDTEITVSAERAEALLARVPMQRGDGTWKKYSRAGESNVVTKEAAKQALVDSLKKGDD